MEQLTFNIGGAKPRHETLDGKDYLAVPMAMLTEGVHAGSNGPLFYPREELSKTPGVWNMKPLVVYHPTQNGQGVSACTPAVIETRAIGIVMNSLFDNKLRAEAWIDPIKCKKVDERVLNSVNKGEMVEVSTGLFTDNEQVEGEFNGKKYVAIARNYRPDHLAILPDKKGACSIADGAGLLQLNEANHDLLGNDEEVPQESQQELLTYNNRWPAAKRDKLAAADFAGPNQTFPIKTQKDVDSAAKLAGHAKDPDTVKRRIKSIAKRKGLKLPSSWEGTTNASHGQIRTAIAQALQGRVKTAHGVKTEYDDVHDVYSDFFIYANHGPNGTKFYHQGYEMPSSGVNTGDEDPDKKAPLKAKLVGNPKEVQKHYEWRDLSGSFVANELVTEPVINQWEVRQRFIDELKLNGFNTEMEVTMLERMDVDGLALLVQKTHMMAKNGASNFVSSDSAGSSGGGAGTPAGGSMNPSQKMMAQRKARTPQKKRKPLNAIMSPGTTGKY